MKKAIRWVATLLLLGAIPLFSVLGYYSIRLPEDYYAGEMKSLSVHALFPVSLELSPISPASAQTVSNKQEGTLSLFGLLPIKGATLHQVSGRQVLLGGEPFGVKLFSQGVMVTGFSEIQTTGGKVCPAKEAGLQLGDVILSVNQQEISSNAELSKLVNKAEGKELCLQIQRNKTAMILPIHGAQDKKGNWKLGCWVKDSSAGIGTVTFYQPETGGFGGLGHPICEEETGQKVPLRQGELVQVVIQSFEKGTANQAGELHGYFSSPLSSGTLWGNTDCGLFGSYRGSFPDKPLVTVAHPEEVKEGKATVWTTISGNAPKEYEIEIEKIRTAKGETKNLVLKVTDQQLLSQTGGILQGMSGSPILQEGKLVGAVTHVFLGDPAHGYGVFASTMLEEAMTLSKGKTAAE